MLISQGWGNPGRLQIDLGKWHEGASKQEKIPSPNDILFYPCSHRVNPPRLSSLNEINEAASRKNRYYEWLALERFECATPKLKGPGGRVAGWPGGRVDSMSESQTSCPGFESCSEHLLDLFLGCPKFTPLPHL